MAELRRRPLTPRRLGVIVALVVSLMLTLFARLYYVQLLDPHKPVQSAHQLHEGVIVVPAPRGPIVDARGRPLVANTTAQVVTVNRDLLQKRPDHGAVVITRLAKLLGRNPVELAQEITPCSPKVAAPCWTGQPYQPVPVAVNAPTRTVLSLSEHREDFPGVAVQTVTLPSYPYGSLAGHILGYTSEITEADKKANPALTDSDTIGVTGLQQQYDSVLRGVDGKQIVLLNPQGYTVRTGAATPPTQGDTLITSIDLDVQRLAEQSLVQQISDSRKAGHAATGGAVVVMNPNNGRIVAVASYPSYDPSLFVGGVSNADYRTLTDPAAGTPLLNRAIAGEYAPGSTFKLITSSSLVMHHEIDTTSTYSCPGSVAIDGRIKTNFESEALGDLTLRDALGHSCDTFFYQPTAAEYYRDQARIDNGKRALEFLQHMATSYGVGRAPGVDLPRDEQASGGYADRETRMSRWKANRSSYCAAGRRGYPDVADASERAYLTALAKENCTDGWRYRAGDNADMSIGQGETTMSPLQLAVAYSALLNGGRILQPTLGWAVVNGDGDVVRTIKPTMRSRVPVRQSLFNYITSALDFSRGWAVSGAFAYIGSKYQNRLGGKTGTAEVYGKGDTSWLVSWGPTTKRHGRTHAKFVMVGMVEQAGTGATAAGPMLKRIWDGVFGENGKPIIAHSRPETRLPKIAPQVKVTTR